MLDILFWVSIFTGGLMFLMLILSLVGGLDFDLDLDMGDADVETGGGLGIVKGVLTFIAVSTWMIRILLIAKQSLPISILGGIVVGVILVFILGKLLGFLISQQEFNTWSIEDALYNSGKVYLKIPVNGQGIVHVVIKDGIKEINAITKDKVDIPTGTEIEVIDVEGDLVVVTSKV